MSRPLAAAAILALVGCSPLIGASDYDTEEPPRYRDPADLLPASCRPCIEEHCSDEDTACANDSECDAVSECMYGNVNPAQSAACSAAHPKSAALAGNFAQCVETACNQCWQGTAWSCVGSYLWPLPEHESETVEYTLIDYVTSKPLVGVDVDACDRRDPECATPSDEETTDENGIVRLTLPMLKKSEFGAGLDGFDGFLLVTGPGLLPTYRYSSLPVVRSSATAFTIVNAATTQSLAQAMKVALDPTRALLVAEIWDCFGIHAPGVRFDVDLADAKSVPYYLVTGLPSTTQSETTVNGIGGVVNAPPGQTTVVAVETATGRELARSTVQTHAGAITTLYMLPSP